MIYFFYDVLLLIAYVFYLPVYALRGRVHPEIWSRLGFLKQELMQKTRGRDVVWLHAVSVGEARAADALLRLVRATWPEKRIVVSTVTPTGQAIVKTLLIGDEVACYAPLDISWAVGKYLEALAPGLLIIMETELWPNLLRLSRRRGVPVIIVNGRVSDKSFRRYGRFRPFLKELLRCVALFCMQNEEAAGRIVALGAPRERVRMTGNIKFDMAPALKTSPFLESLREFLGGSLCWIAGSTHEKEEEMLVGIYKSLRKDFAHLRLILAPRHLERLGSIRRSVRLQGLEALSLMRLPTTRPKGASGQAARPVFSSSQVLLVDTIGDLGTLYQVADIVFVGGSLVKRGGHNPIEPAVFAKPVLFGPYMFNFREIRDTFLREGAAVEVETPEGLEYELRRLLADPAERKALGMRARRLIDRNRGAAQRTFEALREVVET